MNKELDLNLNGDTFAALKEDFNQVLSKTIYNMKNKGSELAEVSMKLKISLKEEEAPVFETGQAGREIVVPQFDHKVSSVMQIKQEVTGSLGGNYELVWDDERGEWVMREVEDGQMNIFNAQYREVPPDNNGDDGDGDGNGDGEGQPALAGHRVLSLPSGSADDDDGGEHYCEYNCEECDLRDGCDRQPDGGVYDADGNLVDPTADDPEPKNDGDGEDYDYQEPGEVV